jgi:Ankyrin repeat
MDALHEIAIQIELHSVEGIKACFQKGVSPNDLFKGKPLLYELISEYTRSSRFKQCVKAFVDSGLAGEDPVLLAVLLDDAAALKEMMIATPEIAGKRRYSLRCAYTPLEGVTLLHICAEFNHVACAEVLVKAGADVNARASLDENGWGGQTPVFHTVNQNGNQSQEMMEFLLANGADLGLTIRGVIWGKGYDWETLIPLVNPISYAVMGLLPQMHRDEVTTHQVVARLMKQAHGMEYPLRNVPCQYLLK